LITTNPSLLVDLPKLKERAIVRLEPEESANLLDEVESGESLTDRQSAFHEKTQLRDLALVSLLLGTGIRISECVAIDISDIDFTNNSFRITRKGGDEAILYLPEEVVDILKEHIRDRAKTAAARPEDADALFLSLRKTRLTVSTIEKMLKKYATGAVPLKNISPHKLRSTYGTNLYRETGDIYLVSDVLGHKDVNTTRKHYVTIDEDRRKLAAKSTKLR
jgi:site-specific recombinase XerD